MQRRLMELCALPGVSGWEDAVRDYIWKAAEPHADSLRCDAMGNLLVSKKGESRGPVSLLLCAHMDEVGLLVQGFSAEGFVRVVPVGGVDRRVLLGKSVLVGPKKLPGVIALKAVHLLKKTERDAIPPLSAFYLDMGFSSREEAAAAVSPGDAVSFDTEPALFGEEMISARALDDRIGCAVLLELLSRPLAMDCTFAFTVQEEVGCRGAFGAGFSASPQVALVLEGTTAADLPHIPPHRKVCQPGKGPVIPFRDGGSVYDRTYYKLLGGLAEGLGIPWQTKHYLAGGTDASTLQRSRSGVRVAGISAAVRYLHTPAGAASLRDCRQMAELAQAFVTAVAQGR